MIRSVFFVFVIIIFGCTGSTKTETSHSATENPIEDIKLKTIDGDDIDLEQYKGKTIFMNFWATWCRPCIMEMPSIEKASQKLKDEKIVFLMVSNETKGQIKDFADSHTWQFNYARLDMPLEQLNIQGLPTTYIINAEGQLVFSEMGARDWSSDENIQLIQQHMP